MLGRAVWRLRRVSKSLLCETYDFVNREAGVRVVSSQVESHGPSERHVFPALPQPELMAAVILCRDKEKESNNTLRFQSRQRP